MYCTLYAAQAIPIHVIYTSPFCFPPSIFGGCVMGPLAAGVGFVGPLPCPLIKSMRWSPLFSPCAQSSVSMHESCPLRRTHLLGVCVPASAELCTESGQSSCLVLLHVQQLLRAGIPQWRIPYVFRALVYGLRVCRA
jgi:hypothetical protein